ncbi:MAG TPA: amidohydrolase family protein [Planctomycetota bacterium]|nr:amidohydrolase family protein [Planctomycetota bacterium]
MTEKEHFRQIDEPVYRNELAPYLPERILDAHVHLVRRCDYLPGIDPRKLKTTAPEPVATSFTPRRLAETMRRLFPRQRWEAFVFHAPYTVVDIERANRWIASLGRKHRHLHPLMIVRPDMRAKELDAMVADGGFVGLKPYLSFARPHRGETRIGDFLTRDHLEVAVARGLAVILHIPRKQRAADPVNIRDVARLCERYPTLKLVIAHCGRSYGPYYIEQAIGTWRDFPNLSFDVSAVDDAETIEVVLANVGHRRLLYGSDLPVTLLRGRHLCVNRHCFFLTEKPCPNSVSPPKGAGFPMTFMVYETVRAVLRACRKRGLPREALDDVFYCNAARLIGLE